MPIVIVTPAPGEQTGPGFVISGNSDFIGPLVNPFWRIRLQDLDDVYDGMNFTTSDGNPSGHSFFAVANPVWNADRTRARSSLLPHLGNAHLNVTFEHDLGVVESTTVNVVADLVSGVLYNMDQAMSTGTAQLTEEEHDAVLQTNVGVIAMSGINVAELVSGAAAAIASSPPLGWGGLSGAYTISGDGELPDLHAPFQDRYGVYFVATVIPAGLGHLHGQTEDYQLRMVQWRTTHVIGGIEMVTEIFEPNWHGGLWRFQNKLPERVQYSILPGVVMEARWWQFP